MLIRGSAPGVGKGTQTERLMQRYPQLCSIATGDLLRNNVKQKTALGEIKRLRSWSSELTKYAGQEASSYMKSGKLVPDPLMLNLILSELTARKWISTDKSNDEIIAATTDKSQSSKPAVEPSDDPDSSFILDGFPRTAPQAQVLSRILPMNLVFQLVTPVDIILSRMANRWTHAPSGRVYNVGFNDPKIPGKDDITGEDLVQREDDSEATWRKRLATFDATSNPLLDFYREMDPNMVVRVQGNSSDEISPQIYSEIEKRFGS